MRRRFGWLIAAAVLFAGAAWLMLRGEEEERVSTLRDRVSLPKRQESDDRMRAQQRRTWVAPLPPDSGMPTVAQVTPKDPLFTAILAKQGESAIVLEANAIRHSKLGELLVACMNRRGGLDRFTNETGVDPLQDVDRIAAFDKALVVSGNFENAKWSKALERGADAKQYGDHGTMFNSGPNNMRALRDGGSVYDPRTVVNWKDQMVIYAEDEEAAKQIVDRLEGRAPAEDPLLNDSMAYGEVYGVISAKMVAELLPEDQVALKQTLEESASRIELHADTLGDVGIVADVQGPDADKVKDLGKSLGAALAIGRMQASAEGKNDVAELMDLAKVVTKDGEFRVEFALPMELLEKRLAFCRLPPDAGE